MARTNLTLHTALVVLMLGSYGPNFASATQALSDKCDGTVVDYVWTGARVQYGSVKTDRYAFVAYYASDRHLTVARVNLQSCGVERKTLPTIFAGWDSHNLTTIALDRAQIVHVAGNMHGAPLRYFRGTVPLDVRSVEPASMVKLDESRVTYPKFLKVNGGLAFFYREGKAGDGNWFLNRWVDGRWTRLAAAPIFGAEAVGQSAKASAYPTEFVHGPDGTIHVAVVWRAGKSSKDRGVQNNFRVSYAKTKDFQHWTMHDNRPLASPLTPESMELIDDVGINNGLVNNAKLTVGPNSIPYIVYTKYTKDGRNGVFIANPSAKGWTIQAIAESRKLHPVTGRGTLKDIPRFSALSFDNVPGELNVNFTGEPRRTISLPGGIISKRPNPSLKQTKKLTYPDTVTAILDRLDDGQIRTSIPEDANDAREAGTAIRFIWAAEKPNNDLRLECTLDKPTACTPPPSPLVLQVRP